jgi:hypothetical protein
MAENLVASVRREIDRLQKQINQRISQLASLEDELIRHQRVYRLLGGADRRPQRPRRARGTERRSTPVNWNSVLQGLPSRFTVGDLAKRDEAKRKLPVDLRQIAVRWAKQGKTKRVERGKYQKVQQGKSRAAVASQRKK